ncbi:hypothetical protein [Vibrio phage J14]|nr:hypothetical protein [Vibrio phage J14]
MAINCKVRSCQKVTSYTVNLIPTIYDLSRLMSAGRIMVVTRVPSLENDSVTRAKPTKPKPRAYRVGAREF